MIAQKDMDVIRKMIQAEVTEALEGEKQQLAFLHERINVVNKNLHRAWARVEALKRFIQIGRLTFTTEVFETEALAQLEVIKTMIKEAAKKEFGAKPAESKEPANA